MGRPSELTPAMIAEAHRYIQTCLYVESLPALLGISKATFYSWLKRGAKEQRRVSNGGKPKEDERTYAEFLDAIKKGRALGELEDLEVIKKASKACWQAAAWRLERRFPEKWGNHAREIRELAVRLRRLEEIANVTD